MVEALMQESPAWLQLVKVYQMMHKWEEMDQIFDKYEYTTHMLDPPSEDDPWMSEETEKFNHEMFVWVKGLQLELYGFDREPLCIEDAENWV